VQNLDERAFERTVEEIKYRYYEVARALKKLRNSNDSFEYDIEREIQRKNNWEKIFSRGKE
jgi:hypothetical protein